MPIPPAHATGDTGHVSDHNNMAAVLGTHDSSITALVANDFPKSDFIAAQTLIASQQAQITALQAAVNGLVGTGGGTGGTGGAGTITFSTPVQASTSGSQTQILEASHVVAAGVHELIVVVGYGDASSAPNQITAITFGAANLTKVPGSTFYSGTTSSDRGIEVWHLTNPTASTAAITVFMAASQFGVLTSVNATSSTGSITFGTAGGTAATTGTSISASAASGGTIYVGGTITSSDAITVGGSDTSLVAPSITNTFISFAAIQSADNTIASSWASTHRNACTIVPLIAGASGTSAPAMPTGAAYGLTQVFSDDFTTATSVGSWTTASSSSSTLTGPSAYTANWSSYPTAYKDTSNRGHYDPAQTLSTASSSLKMHLFYDPVSTNPATGTAGVYACAAPIPKLPSPWTGGIIESCFRVTHGSGTYKFAWLFWPDSNVWPAGGEIDFPECNLNAKINAFNHWATSSGGQDGFPTNTYVNDGAWHRVRTEWINGTSVKFYLDNVLVGTATTFVPTGSMHFVFQSETNIGGTVNTADTADVEIAWVVAYR